MAGENARLQDLAIAHAIGVRRLTTGVVQEINRLLNTVDADLVARLHALDPTAVSAGWRRQRLDRLLIAVRQLNRTVYAEVGRELRGDLVAMAQVETQAQARQMAQVGFGELTLPTRAMLVAAVTDEPFNGRLLREWVSGPEEGRFIRLRDTIRMGVVEGESIDDIIVRVRGTRLARFRDGVLAVSRRSAEAMVRTAVNYVMNAAHQLTFEENADLLDGVRWVATLEPRTCLICAERDGTIYPVDQGPRPPAHINCRCTIVPVVRGGGGAERLTFRAWLARQPSSVQDDALGPTRAAMYRRGTLSLSGFVDDGRILTLDQLAARGA